MSIEPLVTLPPDEALCEVLLHPDADLDLLYGKSLFVGPPRAMSLDPTVPPMVPARAVFVLVVGGATPATSHDRTVQKTANVQIYVRGERDAFELGQQLARDVWRVVHNTRPDHYLVVECLESEPHYNGAAEGHHEWVIAMRAVYTAYTA